MLGLSIKLSQTQSSTAISHLPTVSACAQNSNYISLNPFPKLLFLSLASPYPHLELSLALKGSVDCQWIWASFPPSAFLNCLPSLQFPLLKMLMLPFSAWIPDKHSQKEPRMGGNMGAEVIWTKEQLFIWLSLCGCSLPSRGAHSRSSTAGGGEEEDGWIFFLFFFHFKIKIP